jgi:asparagine synthase (glutamine-hydrolysing)
MCGIVGVIGKQTPHKESLIREMNNIIAHRGPDDDGFFIDASVALGMRRLSIIDLKTGKQPIENDDGTKCIFFNGEIYNFQEERELLKKKGYVFKSTGDTEVLLNLYREYGEQCIDHLRGMFAFAIHDRKKDIVFLARDRVGKKPMKYFVSDSMIAFASELKALRTLSDCPKAIDKESVHHFSIQRC